MWGCNELRFSKRSSCTLKYTRDVDLNFISLSVDISLHHGNTASSLLIFDRIRACTVNQVECSCFLDRNKLNVQLYIYT